MVLATSKDWLTEKLKAIEDHLNVDVLTLRGPILPFLDHKVREALEYLDPRRETLLVILDTGGGIVEIVERIVTTMRHYYDQVKFLVPDQAMSAGTVLVMSGDTIMMDHFSVLGPVDPQIQKDDILVPALSYLIQYERLVEKSKKGTLSSAELVMLQSLDLAELHTYELAKNLSIELIREWLIQYKFKDWTITQEQAMPVTEEMKTERAHEIAEMLSKHDHWRSHGRGINMETLRTDLNLKIDDFSADPILKTHVRDYFWFLADYMNRAGFTDFVHSRVYS